MAEALVSKGLATVVRYKPDDDQRSCKYDELLSAENNAIKKELGVHSKKESSLNRVTEIVKLKIKNKKKCKFIKVDVFLGWCKS